ncbi:MAG: class I SAM-dependent methyltransferase [Candidatus Omnitrophota bacterium]
MHIDFFQKLPVTQRGERIQKRLNLSPQEVAALKKYGYEYFDGELGYGGYYYDGRWKPVAEEMIAHYGLTPESNVLEVGCAKGYLMYEFFKLGIQNVYGCDISEYAISQVPSEIAKNFKVASADSLPFDDAQIDLVLSIDCIHNLYPDGVDRSIQEMMRVSKKDIFIRVGSFVTDHQLETIKKWAVTSLTFENTDQWLARFQRLQYSGDWYFRIMDELK